MSNIGLKGIAIFETVKGAVAVLGGILMLLFSFDEVKSLGTKIITSYALDPMGKFSRFITEVFSYLNPSLYNFLIAIVFFYAAIRFFEAYGLWRGLSWARWLAIISFGIFLPLEFYDLYVGPSLFSVLLTLCNVGLVVYLILFWKRSPQTLISSR